MKLLTKLFEQNLLPDFVIRSYIRKLCYDRLRQENKGTSEKQAAHFKDLLQKISTGPIAVDTIKANEQHYELPTTFFQLALGKNLKYSSCFWDSSTKNLDEAEDKMLSLYCERAEIKDGHKILELGCGWGSLSLYIAKKFPNSSITAVSNSKTQKIFIDQQAIERGIKNLTVITANINEFTINETFDRIVSIEMFEHMRNYKALFQKVAGLMKPDAKLFVHIFCHKEYSYLFEVIDETDWMAKYFFSGGIMPGKNLFHEFSDHIQITKQWDVDGTHYEKTSLAWLQNMDKHKKEIMPIMESTYGKENAVKWWAYWRVFFMSCEELFGLKNGQEWLVGHYLFEKKNI